MRLTVAFLALLVAAPLDEVCFTPPPGCAARALTLIAGARHIRVQEYELTAPEFIAAIKAAHARHADVEVILDKRQKAVCDELAAAGVPAFLDSAHAIAHEKAIVLDRLTVLDGSYNLSKAAEKRNAEAMPIRSNRKRAAKYLDNYAVHRAHSVACGTSDGGTGS